MIESIPYAEVYPTSAVLCIMHYPPFMPLSFRSRPRYMFSNEYPPHAASFGRYIFLLCPLVDEHDIWRLTEQPLRWLHRQAYDAQTQVIRQFIEYLQGPFTPSPHYLALPNHSFIITRTPRLHDRQTTHCLSIAEYNPSRSPFSRVP